MQKIAICADFGGFSVSKEATEWMAKRGSKRAIEELKESERDPYWYGFGIGESKEFEEGYSDHRSRTDPDLIAAIETLGDRARRGSKLKVVEVPDGVEWYIHEYDGWESVHEVHRVWE